MFNVIVDGEVTETVMLDSVKEIKNYINENYTFYGIKASYRRIAQ